MPQQDCHLRQPAVLPTAERLPAHGMPPRLWGAGCTSRHSRRIGRHMSFLRVLGSWIMDGPQVGWWPIMCWIHSPWGWFVVFSGLIFPNSPPTTHPPFLCSGGMQRVHLIYFFSGLCTASWMSLNCHLSSTSSKSLEKNNGPRKYNFEYLVLYPGRCKSCWCYIWFSL